MRVTVLIDVWCTGRNAGTASRRQSAQTPARRYGAHQLLLVDVGFFTVDAH